MKEGKPRLEEKLKQDYKAQAYKFFIHDLRNREQRVYGKLSLADSIDEEIKNSDNLSEEEVRNKQHKKAKYVRDAEEIMNVIDPLTQQAERISRTPGLQNLDFQEVINNSLDILKPFVDQQENGLDTSFEADDYMVENYLLAERVVYNVLENALEHNEEVVEINVEDDIDNLYIEINDGYNDDITEIYSDDFKKATRGSEITWEAANLLGINIEQLDDTYRLNIPKDYHVDISS